MKLLEYIVLRILLGIFLLLLCYALDHSGIEKSFIFAFD